ncbi:MAG: hypothetical protein GY808_06830 [Gammaproteobacteria bacterium]|nr:hypothetical protein [Gammaproteobacteria bacterium]
MALTIRLTTEEDLMLQELMQQLNCKTASKAIIKMISTHGDLLGDLASEQFLHDKLERKLADIERAYEDKRESSKHLNKLLSKL